MLTRRHTEFVVHCSSLLRAILGGVTLTLALAPQRLAAETTRLVKMEFEATVTDIVDPLGLFPSVDLGDAASGTLLYDPLNSSFLSEPNIAHFFVNPLWMEAATLVIHGSDGVETAFLADSEGAFPFDASMFNDLEDEEAFEETDGISIYQTVIAPEGFTGAAAGISVGFFAPGSKFDGLDDTLPDEIVLDDWPIAVVSFFDLLLVDENATELVATIHTLRAVEIGPGDFNVSGSVDAADLRIWQEEFGLAQDGGPSPSFPYADANGDGDSDGNDFLVWQRNMSGGAVSTTIPEPSGLLLAAFTIAMAGRGRSHWRKFPKPQYPKVGSGFHFGMVDARDDERAGCAHFFTRTFQQRVFRESSRMRSTTSLLMFCAVFSMDPQHAAAAPIAKWIRQFGTSEVDYHQHGESSADGRGNFYVAGSTYGDLSAPNAGPGNLDGYISKYNVAGSLLWGRQLGTPGPDELHGASSDKDGNVYVVGATDGDLGSPNAGFSDAFLWKYSSEGDVLWTRLIGTPQNEGGNAVAADAFGNAYVAGSTGAALGAPNQGRQDAYLSRFNSTGDLIWTRQWGTAEPDHNILVEVDATGDVLVVTSIQTAFALLGYDLRKFDAAGDLLWSHSFETAHIGSLATDAMGNVFVSGITVFGRTGIFAKFSAHGEMLWSHEVSTGAISVDAQGNAYAAIGAQIVEKYGPAGEVLWAHEVENDADPAVSRSISNISVDALENIFISGQTRFHGNESDVWLSLIRDEVPEPSSVFLLVVAGLAAHDATRRMCTGQRSNGAFIPRK